MTNAIAAIREGTSGPIFIECATYRWLEHVGPLDDHSDNYRDTAEYQSWKDKDQITRLANMLDAKTRTQVEDEVTLLIQDAEKFAEESSYPAAEELYTHVYAN
jgi:pyruvate dehydrogenase E1 component alpha subunit